MPPVTLLDKLSQWLTIAPTLTLPRSHLSGYVLSLLLLICLPAVDRTGDMHCLVSSGFSYM